MYQNSEKHKSNLKIARQKAMSTKLKCQHCNKLFIKANIKKHIKSCKDNPTNHRICPVCNKYLKFSGTTCSHSCANTFFRSGDNHPNAKVSYKRNCFNNHEKKCIICGESLIVAVHHLDGDHSNNEPANLIPLCPTHHIYWHSKHKHLIEEKVLQYITKWSEQGDSNSRFPDPKSGDLPLAHTPT